MKSHLISLDRERRVKFSANAIADFEWAMGYPFSNALKIDAGIQFTRCLLWAGLRQEDPKITIQQTGDLIDAWIEKGGQWHELTVILFAALIDAGWIKKPEERVEDPNPAAPPESGE